MFKAIFRGALILPLLLISLEWASHSALSVQAATISVCPTTEAALTTAISNAGVGGTVQFSCSTTVTLASTIILSQNVTITGNNFAVTINGGRQGSVFQVNSGVTATLNDLTITNGVAQNATSMQGGGIYNSGTLTVSNCTLSGNSAYDGGGGIYDAGAALTVTNSTVSGNSTTNGQGAGIYKTSSGTLTIANSLITDNQAQGTSGYGGGVYNASGTMTVDKSTFSSNAGTIFGGGIYNQGGLSITNSTVSGNSATLQGGGIENYSPGTLNITNSTVSGNAANGTNGYGGGIDNQGSLSVTNGTFSGNSATKEGGAINGTWTMSNTIVAGSALSGGDCANGGSSVDHGDNFADDASCGFTQPSSKNSATALNLAALANNGGPLAGDPDSAATVQTVALLNNSQVLGAASCLQTTDERGDPRPDSGDTSCDSGAYEYQGASATATSTPTATHTPTNTPTPTRTSTPTLTLTATATATPHVVTVSTCNQSGLQSALTAIGGNGTVQFGADCAMTTTSTISLAQHVTIDGNGHTVTLSGGGAVEVFAVSSGATVALNDLTFTHGQANNAGTEGGAVLNSGNLSVTNSTFSNNGGTTTSNGGAIANDNGGSLSVTNSTFSSNTAGTGGAIANLNGTATVANSTFSGNNATNSSGGGGGAIDNGNGNSTSFLTVTNSTFSGNSVDSTGFSGYGGAILDTANSSGNGSTATVINSTFYNNTACSSCGQSIYDQLVTFNLRNSILASSHGLSGECGFVVPIFHDQGGNFSDENTCGFSPSSHNNVTNLNLASNLASNGGPTQTFALQAGSAAIDAASCLQATDQRGVSRPDTGETICDSGAYEYQDPPPTATSTNTTVPTNTSTNTPTRTPTNTLTPTNTPTATNTPVPTDTATVTNTPTNTSTPSPTNTPTNTTTNTPVPTDTPTYSPVPTDTPSNTATNTPTDTAVPTDTATNTPVPTDTATDTATSTSVPTDTATNTVTVAPTDTPTYTATNTPTATDTPIDTATNTTTSTPTSTATSTPMAALVLSATQGTVRQSIVVTGTHFGANEQVTISWNTVAPQTLTTTVTSGSGSFSVMISIPQAVAGSHTVTATGKTTGRVASTAFIVIPVVVLAHPSAVQGSVNVLTGAGFGSNLTVRLHTGTVTGPTLGMTVTTSVLGAFSGATGITFTVPTAPHGTYKVYGVDSAGNAAFSPLSIIPKVVLSPSTGSVGVATIVTATLTGFGANETVQVYFNCASAPCSGTPVKNGLSNSTGDVVLTGMTFPAQPTAATIPVTTVGATSKATSTVTFTVK